MFQSVDFLEDVSDHPHQVHSVWSVDFIDPYRVEVLKEQEVAKIRLLLGLFGLINVITKHGLLKGLLNYKILGNLP